MQFKIIALLFYILFYQITNYLLAFFRILFLVSYMLFGIDTFIVNINYISTD